MALSQKLAFAIAALLLWVGLANAQTAVLLPNAETQFVDPTGVPYIGGKVYFYIPSTTTPKATWQDPNQSTLNSNPVVLDSAGRAIIYGSGQYRQILVDQYGNTIWDQLTYGLVPTLAVSQPAYTLGGNPTGVSAPQSAISLGAGLAFIGTTLSATAPYWPVTADSTSQSVTCGFNQTSRIATSTITYTLPLASSCSNGTAFWVYPQAGVTITPNAIDAITGNATGASITLVAGQSVLLVSNAGSPGTWYVEYGSQAAPYSFNPINLGLTASAGANALTISLVGQNGAVPSATNPILVPFRSTTLATGVPAWTAITSATAITIPLSATLGTTNGVPFRIWVFLEYNGGSPELVVATCSASGQIYACTSWETSKTTTTTISSSATSGGVPYAVTGVSGDALRIIGYAEYASGLVTAGSWASAPTTLQLMEPGVARPGTIIQQIPLSVTAVGTTTSNSFVALSTNPISQAITVSSSVNVVRVFLEGSLTGTSGPGYLQLYRSGLIGNPRSATPPAGGNPTTISILDYDLPGVAGVQTYSVYAKTSAGTLSFPVTSTGATMELWEIMG